MKGTVRNIFNKNAVIPRGAKCLFILHREFLEKQKPHNPDFMRPLHVAAKKTVSANDKFHHNYCVKRKKNLFRHYPQRPENMSSGTDFG